MIGIDSLGLRLIDFPFDKAMAKYWHQSIANIGEENEEESWICEGEFYNGVIFKFTYRLRDKAGRQSLFIYISSVARLAFGNNYTPFPDIESVIRVLEESLLKIPNIPQIRNLHNARLYRLDIFCHYDVGYEHMENNLEVIYRADYPHRTRGPYHNHNNERYDVASNNGISFYTPSKKTITNFYDKYEQCDDPKTIGYLRHEIQLSNARVIENALDIERPVIGDIKEETVERLFTNDLITLRLNMPIINRQHAEIVLKSMYGVKAGSDLFRLMLYLNHHQTLDKKDLAKALGVEQDTLQLKLNKIAKAGISPYLLDQDALLSPLSTKKSLIS